jgi:glycosyltransferase involved in cell wall biosynthesis
MRVLHLLSSTGYHGAENMAAELIRQLTACGVNNDLGVFRSSDRSNLDILNATQDAISSGMVYECRGRFDIGTVFALRNYIKNHDVDIIHSHKYKTNLYAFLANIGVRKKLVSTCHNWLGDSLSMRFYAWLDKRVLRHFDMVVGVSEEIRNELRRHMSPERIRNVGNGVDIRKYTRTMETGEAKKRLGIGGKYVIGFVGRLSPEKGIDYLLRAVSGLVKDGLDVSALIVGDGERAAALKQEAHRLQITDRVTFTGNRGDTPLLYSAMDVFVLPSQQEAFPMVLLEAMACGVPVVATRVGDVAEIVEPGVSGLLVDSRDAAALQSAIGRILSDETLARRMSTAAQARAVDRFSSSAMAKQYLAIYERITGARGDNEAPA